MFNGVFIFNCRDIRWKCSNIKSTSLLGNVLLKQKALNNNAFGARSIWKYLDKQQHYIVNINLDHPIIFFCHYHI